MSTFNAYMALSGATDASVSRNAPLSRLTTYRVGGPAALHVVANSLPALVKTISVLAAEGVGWVLLGRGSNVLAADAGYPGCVITLGSGFSGVSVGEDGTMTAGAALPLPKLLGEALRHSLGGLEPLAGIPGSLGGAISMDAGTRHEWIGSRVRDLVVLRPDGGLHRYEGSDIEWGYRCTSLAPDEVVLEATLALDLSTRDEVGCAMDAQLRRRTASQPMSRRSGGPVFRDPGDRPAAALIESAGLKGLVRGGARVSGEYANFIVNEGGATASDIVWLIGRVHDAVLEAHGTDLRPGLKLLGFGA